MKLIIDIPDEMVEAVKINQYCGTKGHLESIIANGTPYNPTGDCISRSDLRKEVVGMMINKADDLEEVEFEINSALASVCEKINNAMSMNYTFLPQYQSDLQCAYDCGYEKGKQDRPKGEWKTVEGYDGDEYYECSNCGESWVLSAGTPKDNNMNFCPKCGADMKGGAE